VINQGNTVSVADNIVTTTSSLDYTYQCFGTCNVVAAASTNNSHCNGLKSSSFPASMFRASSLCAGDEAAVRAQYPASAAGGVSPRSTTPQYIFFPSGGGTASCTPSAPPPPNACTCPNGTPTIASGTGGTLCESNGNVDCSACNTGYTISAAAGAGAQTCSANVCTCPNGTPTVASGTGGTLCESNGNVDCSACITGYTISMAAGTGAQICQTPISCTDGVKNGAETGVDCGGQCHACGTVTTAVTLSMQLSTIPVGSSARATFETSFKADVSQMLNISATRVTVNSITAGSVVVEFSVSPSTGLSQGQNVTAAQTETTLLGDMPGSTTLAGQSVSAVSAQLISGAAPPPPAGSNTRCGRPVCSTGTGGIGVTANGAPVSTDDGSAAAAAAAAAAGAKAEGDTDTARPGVKVVGVAVVGVLVLALIAYCALSRKPPKPNDMPPAEAAARP
jgi:hypothetical protein